MPRWRIRMLLAVICAGIALLAWVRIGLHRILQKPANGAAIADRSVTSPLNLPGGGVAPEDAYEVYSALYQVAMPEPLVFAEDSVTDIPQMNGSCLRPTTQEERELVGAFEAANAKSRRWERKFAIPQGYRLIARSEAVSAQTCLDAHGHDAARQPTDKDLSAGAPANCAAYADVRHVRFLGVPGFDAAHARALVSVVKMCGRFCGSGGIFEVEKAGETWKRAEASDFTSECSWMY
jgi:hypothetical protein